MNSSQWSVGKAKPVQQGWISNLFTALFAVGFYLLTLRLGRPSAGAELDPSWSAVLIWAAEHGVRFGHQIVFTYGPLGYVHQYASYDPEFFNTYVVSQLLMGLGYTFVYTMTFRALALLERVLFVAAIVVFAPWLHADSLMLSTGLFALVTLDRLVRDPARGRWNWAGLALLALFLNALTLMKFTVLPTSALLCGMGMLLFLRERRPFGALALALLWIGTGLALWLGHGQYLGDLVPFVRGSLLTIAGYGAAMGADGTLPQLAMGVLGLLAAGFALLLWLWRESPRNLRALAVTGYLAFAVYVFWRAAYTRADDGHTVFFLPQVAFLAFALCALATPRFGVGLRALLALGAFGGLLSTVMIRPEVGLGHYTGIPHSVMRGVKQIFSKELTTWYEQERAKTKAQFDLPDVRKQIGAERIDLLGCAQGIMMLNAFNYAPRPVFQAYSSYSGPLQRLNEAYYLGPDAPGWVLMRPCPIDLHYPTSDDGLALLALLRNYRPVLAEKGYLLFKREAAAKAAPLPEFSGPFTRVDLGEWLDVNAGDEARMIYLRYQPSLLGKLRALALREAKLQLEVQNSAGQVEKFNLVRAVAHSGFLLTPFLASEDIYLRWYLGVEKFPIARVRLVAAEAWQADLFKPDFQIGFAALELPDARSTQPPPNLLLSLYPGFNLAPVERSGLINTVIENDGPALFMHAQAHLDLTPPPGSYSLAATYGLRNEAAQSPGCVQAGADGVRFQLDVLHEGQPRNVFGRSINPYREAADRGPQNAEVARIDIAAGERLRLTMAMGDGTSAACDWGYVSKFQLQPLASP